MCQLPQNSLKADKLPKNLTEICKSPRLHKLHKISRKSHKLDKLDKLDKIA